MNVFFLCRTNHKVKTITKSSQCTVCDTITYCLLWVLLAVGSTAEDPLEVLVRHDQAGLQQVLGGCYGDGSGRGR